MPVTMLISAISAILTPENVHDLISLVDKLIQLAEKVETTVAADLKDAVAEIKSKI